jgi:hypothetical protein
MFVAYTLTLAAAMHLRQPVKLPFPDADKALAELTEEQGPVVQDPPALVEQASAAKTDSDDAVAAWTPPTLAPDPAIMTTDQFKHPTAQQLKDWESAPKIDMFEEPTMKPLSLASDLEATENKAAPSAAPIKVESKLHPVNPYGKRDDDPELSAIQQESPEAYGIVKALLMKKQMGLPMPGQDAAKKESDAARSFGSQEAGPSSSAHIGNMFDWKPPSSAADDLSALEDTSSVSKTVVDDAPEQPAAAAPEPQAAVEEPKAAPEIKDNFNWKPPSVDAEVASAPEAPAAPAAPAAAPAEPKDSAMDSDEGIALNSWLSPSSPQKVPQPQEKSVSSTSKSWGNDMMSRYAADLA